MKGFVGGAISSVARPIASASLALYDDRTGLNAINQQLAATASPALAADDWYAKPEAWANLAGSTIGSVAGFAAMSMGPGGPWRATLMESGVEAANTYADLRQQGVEDGTARAKAALSMAANVALLKVTNAPLFENLGGTRLVSFLTRMASEATQEATQEVIGNVLQGQPWTQNVAQSAVAGGLGGGFMGEAHGALNHETAAKLATDDLATRQPFKHTSAPLSAPNPEHADPVIVPESVPPVEVPAPSPAELVRANVAESQAAREASGFPTTALSPSENTGESAVPISPELVYEAPQAPGDPYADLPESGLDARFEATPQAQVDDPYADLPEAEQKTRDYSSTQVNLPQDIGDKVRAFAALIPDADLAENGRENEPHITVKYGLHGEDPDEIRRVLADEPPITVTLGKTSIFPNGESDNGDVVKIDVDSPDLHRLNKKIAAALPVTDTHPEYKPHVTIAYVKPGEGKKFAGSDALAGQSITLDHIVFSSKDGTMTEIPLSGQAKREGPPSDVATVRERANRHVETDGDALADEYLKRFGPVLNADNASELFPDYAKDADSRARNMVAVRPAASAVIDRAYQRLLAKPTPLGTSPIVLFTAGGNASGKTSSIDRKAFRGDIVFDSTLSQYEPSQRKIQAALDSGRAVQVRYSYRDPYTAFTDGVLPRAADEQGRTVPIRTLLKTTRGARDTVLRIAETYADEPRVHFLIRENVTDERPVTRDVDWLKEQAYPDDDVLGPDLQAHLDSERAAGRVSDALYEATSLPGGARSDRSGDGRRDVREHQGRQGPPRTTRNDAPAQVTPEPSPSAPPPTTWEGIVAAARQDGYRGSDEALKHAHDEMASRAQYLRDVSDNEQNGPADLFRAIVRYGGLGQDKGSSGELDRLWEFSEKGQKPRAVVPSGRVSKKTGRAIVGKPYHRMATGDLGGIGQVLRNNGTGLTLDGMAEALRQEPQYSEMHGPNELLAAIEHALTDIRQGRGQTESFTPRGRWWSAVLRDDGSDKAGPPTGRVEPVGDVTLPGMVGVRGKALSETPSRVATLSAQAPADAPFTLTGEPDKALPAEPTKQELESAGQGSMFDGEGPPSSKRQTGGGSGNASIGSVAKLGVGQPGHLPPSASAHGTQTIRPIQFPELVDLARTLIGTPEVVKAFRKDGQLGEFAPGRGPNAIRIHAELFKAGREQDLAATLAHEIGHLVDWLPDQTLKRGNLLGRIRSLRTFLKHTFADGETEIKLKPVREELQALSDAWRPWDSTTASASFKAYRRSSKELFADAISVLLNDPGRLEKEAPTFYREFFRAIDQKPDVERAFFDLQLLLSGTPEELIKRRHEGVIGMLEEGDIKALDVQRHRIAELQAKSKDLLAHLAEQHLDKNLPIIRRMEVAERAGKVIPEDEDPRLALSERNYVAGKFKAFAEEHVVPVFKAVLAAHIDWTTFGAQLFYERIVAGDRSEYANPRGLSPKEAQDGLDLIQQQLLPAQRTVMATQVGKFRAAMKNVVDQAHDVGLLTDERHADLKKNPAYATFQVIEHIESDVSWQVYGQKGTLKDITNPADATILKTLATIRAIERQKVRVSVIRALEQHAPGDIAQATERWNGKTITPVESKDRKEHLVYYHEKGRLRGKYVDEYIANSINNFSVGDTWKVLTAFQFVNSKWFRPVFTTFSLGFQSANLLRDFGRTWKASNRHIAPWSLIPRYLQAVPLAKARAFGLKHQPSAKDLRGYHDLIEAEKAGILGVTFNDLITANRTVENTQIEDILSRTGIGTFRTAPATRMIVKPFVKIADAIKNLGDFVETLPKAAMIYEYRGKGSIADIGPKERADIREKFGSPDFQAGGTHTPISNNILLFSNAILQAWRADVKVATQPETRAAFWWKTAAVNVAPKLLLFALAYGLKPDDKDKDAPTWAGTIGRALRKISEYDLTNYLPIPLGFDAKDNLIYVRIPQDDVGRVIGGLTWKLLKTLEGQRDVLSSAMQILDYTAGQFPSPAPILQTLADVVSFAGTGQVYDPFRGRMLFTDDEKNAQDFGTLKKFLGYEFQQLGGGIVWKFYPGEARPRDTTWQQNVVDAPVVSSVLGRWIKVSSYGETEALRETQAQVQRDEARRRNRERTAIGEALTQEANGQARVDPGARWRLAREIAEQLYPDGTPQERSEATHRLQQKFAMGAQRYQADPLTDAVLSATSNREKVAILRSGRRGMNDAEWANWRAAARLHGVLSVDVDAALRQPPSNR